MRLRYKIRRVAALVRWWMARGADPIRRAFKRPSFPCGRHVSNMTAKCQCGWRGREWMRVHGGERVGAGTLQDDPWCPPRQTYRMSAVDKCPLCGGVLAKEAAA